MKVHVTFQARDRDDAVKLLRWLMKHFDIVYFQVDEQGEE